MQFIIVYYGQNEPKTVALPSVALWPIASSQLIWLNSGLSV